jgi:hypothetical protein
MRKLIGLVLLVAAVAIGAKILTTGALPTLAPQSEEEKTLRGLERDFRAIEERVTEAQRRSGLTGMDTTPDITLALQDLEDLDRELTALEPKLEADIARGRAKKLHEQIADLRIELR